MPGERRQRRELLGEPIHSLGRVQKRVADELVVANVRYGKQDRRQVDRSRGEVFELLPYGASSSRTSMLG